MELSELGLGGCVGFSENVSNVLFSFFFVGTAELLLEWLLGGRFLVGWGFFEKEHY